MLYNDPNPSDMTKIYSPLLLLWESLLNQSKDAMEALWDMQTRETRLSCLLLLKVQERLKPSRPIVQILAFY